jgi:hypothetical protein
MHCVVRFPSGGGPWLDRHRAGSEPRGKVGHVLSLNKAATDHGQQKTGTPGDFPIVSSIHLWHRRRPWVVLLYCVVGCGKAESVDERPQLLDPMALVPAGGVVTVNGEPLASLVITFLPPSGPCVGTAETDQDGKYKLSSIVGPGVLPGDYKVAISYLVSDKGEPQGMSARSGMVRGPAMLSAKEQLPAEYADLGRTTLSAKVGPRGGQFDFDVPASIHTAEKSAGTKTEESKPAAKKTTETKE